MMLIYKIITRMVKKRFIQIFKLFFILIFVDSNAQSLKGHIFSKENNTTISDAEVIASKNGIKKSTVTDKDGYYYLQLPENGDYTLEIFFNKQKALSKNIYISGNSILKLTISNSKYYDIQAVNIAKKNKLIERKIDRTVFNVENSIFSTGSDLTQVLSGTPMLSVTDNAVSIVGKSGVSIMINDKLLNLSGTDLINYLRSLRSDDIAKIEIITAPPAKYEAQGNSGIINIILKKSSKLGLNGILSSNYNQTSYVGNANNITFNYNSTKVTSSLRLRQYYRPSKATEFIDIIGSNSILSADNRVDLFKGTGANLNFDYKLSSKSNIGFIYDIVKSYSNMEINNTSIYKTNILQDSILTTFSNQKKPTLTHSLNGYYDYKIDSLGKKLSLAANYFSNNPEATVNFSTLTDQSPDYQKIRNTSNLDYYIISAQSDLYLPFKWGTIETGAKFTYFNNNSNVQFFSYENDNYNINKDKSDIFKYIESNVATYISITKNLNEKWSAKAGLRYEYSTINGNSESLNERNINKYGKFFPTIYLEYKLNDDNNLSINYSKRINRPNFTALNPFRWYSNPYSFYTGNPFLSPSYNHNVEISYLFKNKISFTIYGQKLINGYGKVTTVNEGLKEVNYMNFLRQYDLGLNTSLYSILTKWWENNTNIISFYSNSKSSIPEIIPQKGLSVYYTINNTFTINKEKSTLFLLNFYHYLSNKQGNVYAQSISNLSAGVRFSLIEKKLKINVMVEDILKGTQSKGKIFYDDFTQFYNNYYDGRRLSLNVTYSFGNKNVKANNKQIQLDEKSRTN